MAKETTYDTYIRIGGKVNSSLKRATNSACQTLNQLKTTVVAALGIGSFSAIILKLKEMGLQALQTAGQFEQYGVGFATMLGSQEKANVLMKDLIKFAAATPFSMNDLTGGTQRLLAFGMGADVVVDRLGRLGDLSMGSSEKLNRLTLAFGKIKAKGKASMEELNQLTEAGVPILAELAKQQKKSTGQLMKLVSAGKIGYPQVEKAVISLTSKGGQFYQMTLKQSKTLNGLMSTLGDAYAMMMGSIAEKFLPQIKTIVGYLIDNMPTIQTRIESLVNGIINATKGIKTGFDYIIKYGPIVAGVLSYIALATFVTNINNIAWAVLGLGLRFGECAVAVGTLTKAGIVFAMSPLGIFLIGLVSLTVTLVTNWEKLTAIWEQAQNIKINPLKDLTPEEQQKVREYEARNRKAEISMPKKAMGTDFAEGGPTLVGEDGPEIRNLEKGDTIETAMKTRSLFRNFDNIKNPFVNNQQTGLTGGVNVNVTIQGNADDQTIQSAAVNAFQEFKANFNRLMQENKRLGYA